MIFLDKPFVSDFLLDTIKRNRFPVVKTPASLDYIDEDDPVLINEERAIRKIRESDDTRIYTNSENAIGWITENLPFSSLPEKISLFKDKVKFRNLVKTMHPDFFFKEIGIDELDFLNLEELPPQFIIKPATGFFSMGVYKVSNAEEWPSVRQSIRKEMDKIRNLYPREVLDTATFIAEQVIEGEEFAFDAYFNDQGEPVILSILKHIFASEDDVGDRVYLTSRPVVEENLKEFTDYLKKIGGLADVTNFPVHVELRRDSKGNLIPIEINPMRFGGWCTTADLAHYAYGFNAYEYFFNQKKPDWSSLLKDKHGLIYSMIVLDNTTGYDESHIRFFDYEKLLSKFRQPMELRQIDYQKYLVFGFLFAETREEDFNEIDDILKSNLREFVTVEHG